MWRKLVYGLIIAIGIIFIILIGSFFWNKRLHQEVKKQTEALISQERMRVLGQLVAGIAHKLRNPLTAINPLLNCFPEKWMIPVFGLSLSDMSPRK